MSEPQGPVDSKDSQLLNDKAVVIYILGGPGVGKGTQCERLARDFGFAHFSVGDLLREEMSKPGSPVGSLIDQHIRQGKIVPAKIALTLMRRTMLEQMEKGLNIFLVDGFPRSMEQALSFESEVCKSRVTLFFDCSPDIMLERVINRGKTSQRIDDNEEAFWIRWNGYKADTLPVLDYFRERGQVVTINCEGPLDSGYAEVRRIVQEILNPEGTLPLGSTTNSVGGPTDSIA